MIIDENIIIRITPTNFKYYCNVIENIKSGNEYEIKIKNLHKGSHSIIKVQCDVCQKQKSISYRDYLDSYNNYNLYCCSPKCAQIKNKKTCLEKYGNEKYVNIDKQKQTNLERYGRMSYLQSNDYNIKSKLTCLNKYGSESSNSSEIVKKHKKDSMLKKYGVENPSQLNEMNYDYTKV